MPTPVLVYRCLMISPGDLDEARQTIRDALDRWNASVGHALNVRIEVVGWETHGVPDASARPQEILNAQIVDEADFGVALFWTRLGTPTGTSRSGSVEEIERLLARGARVLVYFSSQEVDIAKLDVDQLAALRRYQEELRPRALTASFDSVGTLARDVVVHLTQVVSAMLPGDRPEQSLRQGTLATLTAPIPDVRVKVHASLVGHDLRPYIVAAVQNHSPVPVRIAGIHVRLVNGASVFFKRDAVMGQINGHRVLDSGQSMQFFFDPAEFGVNGNGIFNGVASDSIYALDEIDREYRSEPNALQRVLDQLASSSQ